MIMWNHLSLTKNTLINTKVLQLTLCNLTDRFIDSNVKKDAVSTAHIMEDAITVVSL